MRALGATALAIALAITIAGCKRAPEREPDPIAPLRTFEEAARDAADFEKLPASDRAFGPDPYAIASLPGSRAYAGILRGRDAVVLLDGELREIARAAAPRSPSGLAVRENGEVIATGDAEGAIAVYRADARAGAIERIASHAVKGSTGLRGAAVQGGAIVAIDERRDVIVARSDRGESSAPTCAGPQRVVAVRGDDRAVLIACLFDHAIAIAEVDGGVIQKPEVIAAHDGPIWSIDAVRSGSEILIAAGGVEDHPLDRREGSFGFIDSFVFVYRLAAAKKKADRAAAINVSEHGVVTPKALHLDVAASKRTVITTAGYGGDVLAEITWEQGPFSGAPRVVTRPVAPGAAAIAPGGEGFVIANPLFDTWMRVGPGDPLIVPAPDQGARAEGARAPLSRLGEALFFTKLMAPWNKTDDRLSRFTCEACHFEGYVDGRTHHTGRGDVRATTKPLLGLFNNRPHFSRALDPTMAVMVHSEFRVAGAMSGHDPWFAAPVNELPWVRALGVSEPDLDALSLRKALMTFLMAFTHRPNPAAAGRTSLTAEERRGMNVFAEACAGCHAPRLASDAAASAVPRERWESLVLSRGGPIVWADDVRRRTGVEPYVHEEGARTPSLRRLYKKRPYFTNGAAKTLDDVLARARIGPDGFWHDGGGSRDARALSAEERAALRAWLDLL